MSVFARLSEASRRRKLTLFYQVMKPTTETTLLDVGAEINPDGTEDVKQLIDTYPWTGQITAVNLSPDHIQRIQHAYPTLTAHVANACRLPYKDNSFDVVYSNAVIEHVGTSFEQQQTMAAEIMRVGKKWFVATPNRWYPFEFHMRLPLVTWIPGDVYLTCGQLVHYDHVRRHYQWGNPRREDLRLLSARELRHCFPCSKIIKQRITFMAETIIAVGGDL